MLQERRGYQPASVRLAAGLRTRETASRWVADIASTSPLIRFALAVLLVVVVAALDHVTGSEISFSIFYLLPVAFAAGLISRGAGWAVAVLSASAWGFLDIMTGREYSSAWIPYWNAAVRLGFFLLVTELFDGLRKAHARERALSRTDSLTGLANALVFEEYAARVIAQCHRTGQPFTITYVDLDRFKHVNDEFGHSEGDRLLRVVAGAFSDGLRTTDVVARLGGDEFGILMPDTATGPARVALERVAATLAREVQDRWAVGATFGAVTFNEPPDDVDCAVRQADALMYRGKMAGRDRIVQATWPESQAERG